MSNSEILQRLLDERMDLNDAEVGALKSAIFVLSRDRERRERIATAALQGILANPEGIDASAIGHEPPLSLLQQYVAELARGYADALIAELDKEK